MATDATGTTVRSDDPENEGFLDATTRLRGWRTTEQTDDQILPTTKTPPSFLITFNDSFAKPGPNSVTTFPDPPRTSTTPPPPEGSGDVDESAAIFSSGDIGGEIIKIDEGTLGSKVPDDGSSSTDNQMGNTTNKSETTTMEDVGSGAIDSVETVTLVSNITQDAAISSSSPVNETVETTETRKYITQEVRVSNNLI